MAVKAPSDRALSASLEAAVREALAAGEDDITINSIRTVVEKKFDLKTGFLKSGDWKEKSKEIIKNAFDNTEPQDAVKTPPPEPAETGRTKRESHSSERGSKKRRRSEEHNADGQSDRETSSPLSSVEDSEEDAPKQKRPKPSVKGQKAKSVQKPKQKAVSSSSSSPRVEKAKPEPATKANGSAAAEESDSEISDLPIDFDKPAPKKRSKAQGNPAKSQSKTKERKPSVDPNLDPEEAEIKKLQSWLVKCGIRKLWYKELAACSTQSQKIKHLKQMLSDVGMTGRFSAEKARQIKEERELKADIEEVQQMEKHWGHDDNKTGESDDPEKAESTTKPRRRLARGLKDLAMFDEESGSD